MSRTPAVSVIASGTLTANGTTEVTVTGIPFIATTDTVLFSLKTVGGTPAGVYEFSKTAGTGFSVKSAVSNTSVYSYTVVRYS